jgi:hypothetical protein
MMIRLAPPLVALILFGHAAMGQTDDAARQRYLDEDYPFIDQDPPGRAAPGAKLPGTRMWQGQSGWRTRHGEAVIVWDDGKPRTVLGAHFPDGSRGEVSFTLDYGFRRPSDGEKLWIYGKLDIKPDDVLFVDGEQPAYNPPPQSDDPNLEAELARDVGFRAALQDNRFARAAYRVFSHRTFIRELDGRRWACGERQAAILIAHLRDRGESYQDYVSYSRLKGEYPDDRLDKERRLRAEIEGLAKLVDVPASELPMIEVVKALYWESRGGVTVTTNDINLENLRRELQERFPERLEAWRARLRTTLENAKHNLAKYQALNTNSDVFEALHAHLSRLGWRTENEQDREVARQAKMRQALVVLREVKELEKRPEGTTGDWVDVVRKQQRGYAIGPSSQALQSMSADEREVQTGGLRRRLFNLALTGRITKDEYDSLAARSSGN